MPATTDFRYGHIEADAIPQALPNLPCNFLKLQCRSINTNGSANALTILYGDETEQSIEVAPGSASIWISTQNASSVRVRVQGDGTCTVSFITTNRSASDLVE